MPTTAQPDTSIAKMPVSCEWSANLLAALRMIPPSVAFVATKTILPYTATDGVEGLCVLLREDFAAVNAGLV